MQTNRSLLFLPLELQAVYLTWINKLIFIYLANCPNLCLRNRYGGTQNSEQRIHYIRNVSQQQQPDFCFLSAIMNASYSGMMRNTSATFYLKLRPFCLCSPSTCGKLLGTWNAQETCVTHTVYSWTVIDSYSPQLMLSFNMATVNRNALCARPQHCSTFKLIDRQQG